jgi:pimeloyl-ACP methyl ester carboxylesterase
MKLNFFAWKSLDILQSVNTPGENHLQPLEASSNTTRTGIAKTNLVFLHGMGGTGHIWRPIAAQLEEEFQCIAFDQRGHGGSRPIPPAEDHHFHAMDYAKDVVEMLDFLKIQKCFLIGHSMGVRTAMAVATLIPNRIQGFIAVDIGITNNWGGGIGEPLAAFMEQLPRTFPNKTELRDYLFSHCPDPAIAQYLSAVAKKREISLDANGPSTPSASAEEWSFPFEHEALVETIHQADQAPLETWLIDILDAGVKTLFLHGAQSQVWLKPDYDSQKSYFLSLPSPWNARGLLTFEDWENCGHGLPFEQRVRFIERVKAFVRG